MKSDRNQKENKEAQGLLRTAKKSLPQLKKLLIKMSSHWDYEDSIYRLYHQSCKVYALQENTQKIVSALQALAPHLQLNADFINIITDGTGKKFDITHNKDWLHHTRPIVEAFFHAKYMLEMVCKYAKELSAPPQMLPSGWASVLYLYNLR